MALYNQPYPASYQNPYQPYTPTAANYIQPTQPDNTGIIWVQGESGAKAYPVQNGKSVVLFDSESEHFFIKTTDMSTFPVIINPVKGFAANLVIAEQTNIEH